MSLRMVLLLVGLVFALIALLLVLRAARGRAQRTQAPAASRRASGAHRDNAARRLDRIAQEAFSTITAFLPDTLQRYDVPLVMLAGDAGSGKSSMLENSGLSAVATREQGTAGELRWHHFDQGVVLEVGASYLGIDSLPGQQVPAWNGLGSAMQRYRPRRPVDAIVLTVGADALAGSLEDLELDAEQLQRRLSEMQVQFGLRLPVYLVVTKADLLDDFAPMVAALPASLRNGMLGWSSPYGTAMSYDPSWVGEAFDAIDDTVAELSCEIMAGARPPAGKPGMLGAAQSIAALQVPLRAYLSRLMSAQSHTQPLLLRGIYLCSSDANQPAFVRDLMACKVFAERGMAQPLPGQVWSRDRRVSRWRWATAILILLWLPMLCMADWRLRRVAPDLLATLVQVKNDVGEVRRIRAQGGYVPTAFIRNASDGIVKAMLNRAESLGSYSIPFSWHLWNQSTLDDKVEERFRDGISEIVLPALGKSFNEQVHDLTGARLDPISTRVVQGQGCPPASKEASASLALDSGIDASGSFVALSDYVDQLALLEHHLREFDELQQHNSGTIDEFAELGKYTKTFRISDAERRANPRYFKQALNKVQVDSGALPSKADYLVVLQCGLQQRHDALMATLLERHPLLLYADAVDARMHGALPAHEYDELKSDLNDLKLWLGAPSSNWLHARRLDFGKPYVDLLAKVDALGLFEPKRGPALRAQAEQKLRNMDGKLLAARVSSSPVLQRSADGARLQMSPPVAHLESLLTALMEQPFMAPIGQRPHHTSGGRATLWDLGELNAMLVQVEEQNRYLQQNLGAFPLALQPELRKFADARLKARLLEGLEVAQGGTDDTMAAYVRLGQSQKVLSALLDTLTRLGATEERQALAATLAQQAAEALEGIDVAFEQDAVYLPRNGGFAWWTGSKNPAAQGYTNGDPAALDDYLTAQHDQVERSARVARPVLRLYLDTGGAPDVPVVKRWNAIGRELDRFADKAPGARIAALHAFIRTDLSEMDQRDCQTRVLPAASASSTDFFTVRMRELSTRVVGRCAELARSGGSSAYASLANAFRTDLANKFPFALANERGGMAAEPDDVAAFLQTYDRVAPQARQLLARPVGGETTALARARAFLTATEQARSFLAPLLPPDAASEAGYDLRVRFRVNERGESDANNLLAGEAEGNRIVEWKLQVGDQTLSYRNGDNPDPAPLRWRIGMPVHLALRWAENTATVPQADPKDTHMRVTGRTVHYEFSEPWSLLRLLSNYRVSSARGETLHFAVPLSSAAVAGRNAPAAEVLAPAQVFVRLTLLPPNQKSAVAFPRFPIDAPALEGTVLVRARRENLATNQTGGQP